jgi:hypothetical protein
MKPINLHTAEELGVGDHDAAAIEGELVGEILGIASAEDLGGGSCPTEDVPTLAERWISANSPRFRSSFDSPLEESGFEPLVPLLRKGLPACTRLRRLAAKSRATAEWRCRACCLPYSGTGGSNPVPSSKESANFRPLSGAFRPTNALVANSRYNTTPAGR